jgi:hypothetical protein
MGELSAAPRALAHRRETTMTAFVCCRCTEYLCEHEEKCDMLLRWYDCKWSGTFWRPCECQERGERPVFPVTVRRGAPPWTG